MAWPAEILVVVVLVVVVAGSSGSSGGDGGGTSSGSSVVVAAVVSDSSDSDENITCIFDVIFSHWIFTVRSQVPYWLLQSLEIHSAWAISPVTLPLKVAKQSRLY